MPGLRSAPFEGTERYEVVRLIGEGGMGAVYEVLDRQMGLRCALKVMKKGNPSALLRFKREFRTIAGLRHPNLVRLYDLTTQDDRWFFTMELVDGVPLPEALDPLPEVDPPELPELPGERLGQIARLTAQLLEALEFLHGQGIIHRDLKSDNLLVRPDGTLCLLDFGLVKDLGGSRETGSEGLGIGTLAYMAPEQALGRPVSAAADLYACGCILFELLSGRLPFVGDPFQVLLAVQQHAPPALTELVRGVPVAWQAVVQELLAKLPEQRPTIPELRRRLGLDEHAVAAPAPMVDVESIFVGRQAELAGLRAGLTLARTQQQLQVLLVEGKSGSGKTMLTNELVAQARQEGWLVFRGRCYERELVPFRAFDQIVDGMVLQLTRWPAAQLEPLRPLLEGACGIFPDFWAVLEQKTRRRTGTSLAEHQTASLRLAGQDPQQEAFRSLFGLLARMAAVAPLLLTVDDLQWLDLESLQLFETLLQRGLPGPVVLQGLFRQEDVVPGHLLHELLARQADHPALARITLPPLAAAEVDEYLQRAVAGPLPPEQAELLRQAEGHPLLLAQLCKWVARVDHGSAGARPGVAPSLRDLVGLQLAALSPAARHLLELAATSGGAIWREALQQASELSGEEFEQALDELIGAKLLRPTLEQALPTASAASRSSSSGSLSTLSYDVYHDKYRETAYGELEPARRRELHLALARTLEAEPEGPLLHAEVLLHHYEVVGDAARVAHYQVAAAEAAAAKLAFRHAIALYRQALAAPDVQAGRSRREQAALWQRLGELYEIVGDLHASIETARRSVALLEELTGFEPGARQASRPASDPTAERDLWQERARLAGNLVDTRQLEEGYRAYDLALAPRGWKFMRPFGQALLVILWLRLLATLVNLVPRGWRTTPLTDRELAEISLRQTIMISAVPASYLATGEYALRLLLHSRQVREPTYLIYAEALDIYSNTFVRPPSARALARHQSRLAGLRATLPVDEQPIPLAWLKLAEGLLHYQDDLAASVAALEEAIAICRLHGIQDKREGLFIQGWLAYGLEMIGEYDRALQVVDEMEHAQLATATVVIYCPRTRIAMRRGQPEVAARLLAQWRALQPEARFGFERFWLEARQAALDAVTDQAGEVLARMDRFRGPMRDTGCLLATFPWSHWITPCLEAGLHELRRGRLTRPRQRQLSAEARRLCRTGWPNNQCLGWRARALFAHHQGDQAAAVQLIRQGLATARKLGEPHHRWLCLTAAAEIGVLAGADRDEEQRLREQYGFPPDSSV